MGKKNMSPMQEADVLLSLLMDSLKQHQKNVMINLFDTVVKLEEHLSCHAELKSSITVTNENGAQYEFFIGIKRVEDESDEDGDIDDFDS